MPTRGWKTISIAIATHGRSFYVLDDLAAVRQAADADRATDAFLFQPADAVLRDLARRNRARDSSNSPAAPR